MKINAAEYQYHLSNHDGPQINALYPDGLITSMEDGASAHATKGTQARFEKDSPQCLYMLHPWPARSPDLDAITAFGR